MGTVPGLNRNHGRCRTGDNAADVTHDIIADRGNLSGIAKQPDSFHAARNLPGSHGVKGLFFSGRNRNSQQIKEDANGYNCQKDQKCAG